MRRLRTTSVKSGLAACECSLLAALLSGTAAALGVVSGLSLFAGLRVDACKCAQGTRTLVLLRPSPELASAIRTLEPKKIATDSSYPPSAARARLLAASAASSPRCLPSNWTNSLQIFAARGQLDNPSSRTPRAASTSPKASSKRAQAANVAAAADSSRALRNDVRALAASCSHRWAFSRSPSSYFSHRRFPRSVLFASSWPLALWSFAISTDLATPAQPQMPRWSKSLARPARPRRNSIVAHL